MSDAPEPAKSDPGAFVWKRFWIAFLRGSVLGAIVIAASWNSLNVFLIGFAVAIPIVYAFSSVWLSLTSDE